MKAGVLLFIAVQIYRTLITGEISNVFQPLFF